MPTWTDSLALLRFFECSLVTYRNHDIIFIDKRNSKKYNKKYILLDSDNTVTNINKEI